MMLLNSARQLVQAQNLPEAFNAVEQALQAVPSNMDALILKAQILGAGGRYQEAMAVVDKAMEVDANNALVWSMRAALLSNAGRSQEALPAIDRSLALDPNNPESRALKAAIEERLTNQQYPRNYQNPQRGTATTNNRDTLKSFLIGSIIQILGLVMGTVGALLLILKPQLPILLAFTLISLGLATLCVNAARGSYRYGATRVVLTVFMCLVTLGLAGAIYILERHQIEAILQISPPLLASVLFLVLWLALAAALPLLVAIVGLIVGIAKGVRKRPADSLHLVNRRDQ